MFYFRTNGSSVNMPANSTLVTVSSSSGLKTIYVICRNSSGSMSVSTGVRYYVFTGIAYAELMSGSDVLMNLYDSAGYTDAVGGSVNVYNTLMTFTI